MSARLHDAARGDELTQAQLDAYHRAANKHAPDGRIEVDEDPIVIPIYDEDAAETPLNGAYVAAWIWVDAAELEVR